MQNKTADEVAQLTTGLYNAYTASQASNAPPPSPPPPSQPSGAPAPNMGVNPPNPDLIYSDPPRYQQEYDAYVRNLMQTQMAQLAQPFMQQQGSTAKRLSQMGGFADVWRRWEPEIEMQMQSIPMHLRTSELYDQAAAIVRANHVEEIAQERAQQMLQASNTGTERVPGAGGAPAAATQDKLDEMWDSGHPFFEGLKSEGATKQRIRDFCRTTGQSVDDYVKGATLGVITPSKHGFTRAHA